MKIVRGSLICLLLVGCASAPPLVPASPDSVASSRVERDGFESGWLDCPLPGKRSTSYTPTRLNGQPIVHARSEAAASFLRRSVRIEPAELGTVQFSWRVTELIATADLSDRDAADSPVRLILAFDGDHARLPPRDRLMFELVRAVAGEAPPFATLMYVWDNKAPAESVIHSGRTDRIRKIVLESGPARLGPWHHYERNIAADFRRTFGEEPGPLVSIGLMTDADNTGSFAEAWYGQIRLVGADGRLR